MPGPRVVVPLVAVLGCVIAAIAPAAVQAAPCPGATECPYTSSTVLGTRAGGTFRFPEAVAVAPDGRIYVGDHMGRNVQVFNADKSFVKDFGTQGSGDGEFASGIGGIAVDPATRDVFVVDSGGDRVERFRADGTFIRSIGSGGHDAGQFDFGGGPDSNSTAGGGLAIGNGSVFVADSANNRIQTFSLSDTDPVPAVLPTEALNFPMGVSPGPAGLAIADDRNHRILVVDPGTGATVAAGGGLGAGPGQLNAPYDVAMTSGSTAYVADDLNHRVVIFSAPNAGALPFSGQFGGFGPNLGQLAFTRALALDPGNNVVAADTANNRVERFDPFGANPDAFGTSGRAAGNWALPQGLAADPFGGIVGADTFNYRLQVVNPDGSFVQQGGGALGSQVDRFRGVADVTVAPDGTTYALDSRNRRVVRYDPFARNPAVLAQDVAASAAARAEGGIGLAPDGTLWVADADTGQVKNLDLGTGAVVNAFDVGLSRPQGLRFDSEGAMWIADRGHDRVVQVRTDGTLVKTVGSPGTGAGNLSQPFGVALDGQGKVYVAERANNRVSVFRTGDGAFVTRFGVRGTDTGQFVHPGGVAVDCNGGVTVADTDNNRLQRFVGMVSGGPPCAARPPAPGPPPPPPPPVVAPEEAVPPTTPPAQAASPAVPQPAKVRLSLPARRGALGRKGLRVKVRCDVDCTATVRGVLSVPRRRKPAFSVGGGGTRALPAGATATFRLKVSKATRAKLRKRLKGRRRLVLSVVVKATRAGAPPSTTERAYNVTL